MGNACNSNSRNPKSNSAASTAQKNTPSQLSRAQTGFPGFNPLHSPQDFFRQSPTHSTHLPMEARRSSVPANPKKEINKEECVAIVRKVPYDKEDQASGMCAEPNAGVILEFKRCNLSSLPEFKNPGTAPETENLPIIMPVNLPRREAVTPFRKHFTLLNEKHQENAENWKRKGSLPLRPDKDMRYNRRPFLPYMSIKTSGVTSTQVNYDIKELIRASTNHFPSFHAQPNFQERTRLPVANLAFNSPQNTPNNRSKASNSDSAYSPMGEKKQGEGSFARAVSIINGENAGGILSPISACL